MIEIRSLSHTYSGASSPALVDVDLRIEDGEYLAVAGANGSGKSTLIRCLNGLVVPPAGAVAVDGLDPSRPEERRSIRRILALVFQNPPDQIVASVVEEDTAFGLENLGVPRAEMVERVRAALEEMGLARESASPTRFLSAGQQQRLAVAGALVLGPKHLAFDEATSMIDPAGRSEILDRMDALAASGATVIHVTHDMDEAARARRVVVLSEGRVAFDGTPEELFRRGNLAALGLAPPRSWSLARALGLPPVVGERPGDLGRRAARALRDGMRPEPLDPEPAIPPGPDRPAGADPERESPPLVSGSEVSAFRADRAGLSYLSGTPQERRALTDIDLGIPRGGRVALVGATGSGKSSLLQLLSALAFPQKGRVLSFGIDTSDPKTDLRALRMRTPLSVQRPESALFEYYAGDEVSFGPRNQGLSGSALVARVRSALEAVGLPFDEFRDRPVRSLSGGQKRRLALASVLAMEPEALLLDEPGSALDPVSRERLMGLVYSYGRKGGTVVFATHSMEEAARADLVVVLAEGRLRAAETPAYIFGAGWDPSWGLARPFGARAAEGAREAGLVLPEGIVDEAGLIRALADLGRGAPSRASAGLPASRTAGEAGA
ncbi:MAG TPA: energy-coupling factor transporter ATPase [Spirochaetia bacterium]|nr:energy-coupling factor transporter ATPase [Spirochaetia bacterium]